MLESPNSFLLGCTHPTYIKRLFAEGVRMNLAHHIYITNSSTTSILTHKA